MVGMVGLGWNTKSQGRPFWTGPLLSAHYQQLRRLLIRPNQGDWSGQGNGAFSSSGRAVGGRAL